MAKVAQSAHTRHETYIGTWLSEPADTSSDPGLGAERREALKLAVQVLFEKLSPTERAAYVLREAFDYPYRQIADILQMEEPNARQLVSRARKHIADGRCMPVSSDEQRHFLEAFIGAAQKGDMAGLEALFAEDVVSYSDGDELVRAMPFRFWPDAHRDVHFCRRVIASHEPARQTAVEFSTGLTGHSSAGKDRYGIKSSERTRIERLRPSHRNHLARGHGAAHQTRGL